MKLIDAHTHLNTDPLVQDWQGYLQKFFAVGGVGLVNVGADEQYNLKGIEIAKMVERLKHANMEIGKQVVVKTTLGRHPLECVENIVTSENITEKIERLKQLYSDNKQYVVAIGECGIDLHYPNSLETLEVQKQLFIEHCKIAREFNLPLMVHSRDAFEQTFEILKNYSDLTIYFHCRGYGPEKFRILNSEFRNLFVGFCGNVTYKNAEKLRETLKLVPLTQLLLETDAPYLTPQVIRGETNHPANVKYIYEFVSDFLGISLERLSDQIYENFCRIYKL